MMALRNVMGATTYQFHTEQTIKTLRATANGKTPFEIKEPEKLRSCAERFGLPSERGPSETALALCDFVEALDNSLDPLLDAIKDGSIRGVAGLVSCTTLRDSDQDVHTVRMTR